MSLPSGSHSPYIWEHFCFVIFFPSRWFCCKVDFSVFFLPFTPPSTVLAGLTGALSTHQVFTFFPPFPILFASRDTHLHIYRLSFSPVRSLPAAIPLEFPQMFPCFSYISMRRSHHSFSLVLHQVANGFGTFF